MEPITGPELARRAGVEPGRVGALVELGVLAPAPDGSFRPSDVQRIRLVEAFEHAGVGAGALAGAMAAGLRSLEGFDLAFPDPPGSSGKTLSELCDELGYDEELGASTLAALGLPLPGPADELREDDAEGVATLLRICDLTRLGLDENVAPRLGRIYGDTVRRAAEAAVRFWDDHVETAVATADPDGRLDARRMAVRAELLPALESMLFWLNRRHLESQTLSVIVANTERALERAGLAEPRSRQPAIAFLDLTGFTDFTEARGDEAALELATALRTLVDEVAAARGGRAVKYLGDGVMLHFPHPHDAIVAALELVDRGTALGLPPARLGIDSGRMVFGEGDYFGRTVIVAARITDHASPGEVLVSESVARMARGGAVRLDPVGRVALKGLRSPVALFRARAAELGDG